MAQSRERLLTAVRVAAIALAIAAIALGIARGEAQIVLRKAVRICLECIGVA